MKHPFRKLSICIGIGILLALSTLIVDGYVRLISGRVGLVFANQELVGGDYIAFYTGGSLYGESPRQLYNFNTQKDWQDRFVIQNEVEESFGFLPFVYPPLVAGVFGLFSEVSFLRSYLLWTAFSIVLAIFSIELLLSTFKYRIRDRILVYLIVLAFVPFSINNLAGGQLASLGLFCYALIYYFLTKDRFRAAGVCMLLSYYKPPLFALFSLLASYRFRGYLTGFLISICLMSVISIFVMGCQVHLDYFACVIAYLKGESVHLENQLPAKLNVGIWSGLIAGEWQSVSYAYLASSLLMILYFLKNPKINDSIRHFFIFLILSLIFSPQLNNYDLTILLLPVCWIALHLLNDRGYASG